MRVNGVGGPVETEPGHIGWAAELQLRPQSAKRYFKAAMTDAVLTDSSSWAPRGSRAILTGIIDPKNRAVQPDHIATDGLLRDA